MRYSRVTFIVFLVLWSFDARAAPEYSLKTASKFEYELPFGSAQTAVSAQSIAVTTLGSEFTRFFLHTSSYLERVDVSFSGFAGWGGGNWPEDTVGTITVSFDFGVQTQLVDGSQPIFRPTFWNTSRSFTYECEAEKGCPQGDPEIEFGSFRRSFTGATVGANGREAAQVTPLTQVVLSNPAHGSGAVTTSGNFSLVNMYKSRSDKLFLEFIAETANEFGRTMDLIGIAASPFSSATDAENFGKVTLEALDRLREGDNCAINVISQTMKEIVGRQIERLIGTGGKTSTLDRYTAPVGLAADIIKVVSGCLALDPPDLNVASTIDPDALFSGIAIPPLVEGEAGEVLSNAIERDLKISLAFAASLDAYERVQGARQLEDVNALDIQVDNYLELMDIANKLSKESMTFYATEFEEAIDSAGMTLDVDVQEAINVLERIDEETIKTVLNLTDEAEIAAIKNRIDELLEVARIPNILDAPLDRIRGLSDLYSELDRYTTTDLRRVIDERIGFEFMEFTTEVLIDIRPRRTINKVFPRAGLIHVAILGANDFDALQVDSSSLQFGPAGAAAKRIIGRDIDRDGFTDLFVFFQSSETGIKCGDTEATLVGKTFSGESITGTDSIMTVGCRRRN